MIEIHFALISKQRIKQAYFVIIMDVYNYTKELVKWSTHKLFLKWATAQKQ